MSGSLDGVLAVVTGAAAGIGLATADVLGAEGATVVGLDVTPGEGIEVCDLTDADAAQAALRSIADRFGRLDVLVNNAGIGRHNPIEAIRTEDLDAMWALNVRALILLTREAFRIMAAQGAGQVVNIASTAALAGGAGESAYNATKFAVRGFTQAAVEEGRLHGIRVHGIYPAGVDTGFWASATAEGPGVDTATAFLRPEDVAAAVLHAVAAPAHVHQPEVVVRALADGDVAATRSKLSRFHG